VDKGEEVKTVGGNCSLENAEIRAGYDGTHL
jgi:hypothetical protein